MKPEEISIIEESESEGELIKAAERIGDKILYNGYQEEQVIALANTFLKLNLLSMRYETREEILSVLCDAVSNYNISSKINWGNISRIEDRLEDDLKEYVKEFLHN